MTIKQIDRKVIRTINADIDEALKAVEKKYGVVIKTGNSSFSPANYTTKLSISITDGGTVMTKEAAAYKQYKSLMGFSKDLGDKFKYGGKEFIIVGYKPRSKKYPILADDANGKTYKFPTAAVG